MINIRSFYILLVAISPLIAIRITDEISIGLIDLAIFLSVPIIFSRLKDIGKSAIGLSIVYLLLIMTMSYFVAIISAFDSQKLVFLRIINLFLVALSAVCLLRFDMPLRQIIKFLFISGLMVHIASSFLYYSGIQLRDDQQVLWDIYGNGSSLRAGGILGNSSDLGHYSASWISIYLFYLFLLKKNFLNVISLLAIILSIWAIWATASRAALINVSIVLSILSLIYLFRSNLQVKISIFFLFALTFTILVMVVDFTNFEYSFTLLRFDIFNISGESTFLSSVRFHNWLILLKIFMENWVWGIGYSNIKEELGIFGDNSFLTIAVEFGIFAFIAYIMFWISLFFATFSFKSSSVRLFYFAIYLGQLFHSMSVDTHTIWYSFPYVLFFLIFSFRFRKFSESESDN